MLELKKNILIQKPGKGNSVAVLNWQDYNLKILI